MGRARDEDAAPHVFADVRRRAERVRSECEATAAAYGLADNAAFIDFLCTLGLRTNTDVAKPAWDDLVAHSTSRGF